MKFPIFKALLPLALALFFACKNDSKEAVHEIRENVPGGNADMIRNPVGADQPLDTNLLARIAWEEKEFDFGEVKEGVAVVHTFKFKNTGRVPLIISNARSSCGFTVPTWPETPVQPGETGEISAKFNTEGKSEGQKKVVTVTANTHPNETRVALKGYVVPVKDKSAGRQPAKN